MLSRPVIVSAILTKIREELQAMESIAGSTRDEATSSETKAEGKYDTRATEASYLARGQAWRIVELRRLMAWLELRDWTQEMVDRVVQVGAVVEIAGARQEMVFLAPIGGTKVQIADQVVRVISPSSPLGEAMVELEVGDAFEFESPRGTLEYEITAIR